MYCRCAGTPEERLPSQGHNIYDSTKQGAVESEREFPQPFAIYNISISVLSIVNVGCDIYKYMDRCHQPKAKLLQTEIGR